MHPLPVYRWREKEEEEEERCYFIISINFLINFFFFFFIQLTPTMISLSSRGSRSVSKPQINSKMIQINNCNKSDVQSKQKRKQGSRKRHVCVGGRRM